MEVGLTGVAYGSYDGVREGKSRMTAGLWTQAARRMELPPAEMRKAWGGIGLEVRSIQKDKDGEVSEPEPVLGGLMFSFPLQLVLLRSKSWVRTPDSS